MLNEEQKAYYAELDRKRAEEKRAEEERKTREAEYQSQLLGSDARVAIREDYYGYGQGEQFASVVIGECLFQVHVTNGSLTEKTSEALAREIARRWNAGLR